MTITTWLDEAVKLLSGAGIGSARLDAEIILAHTIKHPRTWLHAHGDEEIDPRHEEIANARIDLRLDHVPVAYIIGHKEFYGRRFSVSPVTLIPRPESEQLIELLGVYMPESHALGLDTPAKRLVDIGTGSGCLGITAKLEHPELDVTLLDTSRAALSVAEKNAAAHDAHVAIMQSNLLTEYPYSPDIVLANLPYVDQEWEDNTNELRHEPAEALYADEKGLRLIRLCLEQLRTRLTSGGIAIFEADPRQWERFEVLAREHDFDIIDRQPFARVLKQRG